MAIVNPGNINNNPPAASAPPGSPANTVPGTYNGQTGAGGGADASPYQNNNGTFAPPGPTEANITAAAGDATSFSPAGPPPDEPVDNRPFDTRLRRVTLGNNAPVTSGAIAVTTPVSGQKFTCYFLFNPTEIDLSYDFDSTQIGNLPPTDLGPQIAQNAPMGLLLNQTLSFSLFFDRTYELWAGGNTGPNKYGVLWDIWAIDRLNGVYGQAQSGGLNSTGPPGANLLTVDFGGTGGNPAAGAKPQIGGPIIMDGWMTAMDVQYTRFDGNMTPSRCAVSLTLQRIYQYPGATQAADSASSNAVSGGNSSSTTSTTGASGGDATAGATAATTPGS